MEWNVERNMEWTMVSLSHKHANYMDTVHPLVYKG